jgi:uncharacterized protein (TIGR00369 family)
MAIPDLDTVRGFFARAPFVVDVGMQVEAVGDGEITTSIAIERRHLQHSGQVHAGVMATMADHTSGAAAQMMAAEGELILTAEMKLSLLRAAKGERLVCHAKVLKPGRRVSFVEADVWCRASDGSEQHVARFSATMAVVPMPSQGA